MIPWERRLEEILDRAPTRAMVLSRLLEAARAQSPGPVGGTDRLLVRMKEKPETFMVIPDRLGPWIQPLPSGGIRSLQGREEEATDPWILVKTPPSPGVGSEGRMVGKVQESLQVWGKELDTGSQRAIARWIDANWEAEEILFHFVSPESRER